MSIILENRNRLKNIQLKGKELTYLLQIMLIELESKISLIGEGV